MTAATTGKRTIEVDADGSASSLRGPTDLLHLHVPNGIVAECGEHAGVGGATVLPTGVGAARDPAIERLGMALPDADRVGHPLGHVYADPIGLAIVTRLLDAARKAAAGRGPRVSSSGGSSGCSTSSTTTSPNRSASPTSRRLPG